MTIRPVLAMAGLAVLLGSVAADAAAARPAEAHAAAARPAGEIRNADGLVFRYYAGYGYRFQRSSASRA